MEMSPGGCGCRLKMGCEALERCDSIIACWMKSTMLVAATGLDVDDELVSVWALKLNEPMNSQRHNRTLLLVQFIERHSQNTA